MAQDGHRDVATSSSNSDLNAAMADHYTMLLEAVCDNPQGKLSALPRLTRREQGLLLHKWNDTGRPSPRAVGIHELIAEQAVRTPRASAVISESENVTYAELNRKSNQLAHHLQSLGAGPDAIVALCLGSSSDLIVSLLAVLKSGSAYLALDPAYPAERLAFMLKDSNARIFITHLATRERLPGAGSAARVCLNEDSDIIARQPTRNPSSAVHARNLAYITYTSGSTGRPKAVMVSHGSVLNYLTHAGDAYGAGSGSGAPLSTSISFDGTVPTVYLPLMFGKAIHLLPEYADGEMLIPGLSGSEAFSMVKLLPSQLPALAEVLQQIGVTDPQPAFVVGGEALHWRHASPRQGSVRWRLFNQYCPTETTVACTIHALEEDGAPVEGAVPIGHPIANTRTYVLDGQMELVPVGASGELYVGGAGLARGYLGRPGLTAERFVADPFSHGDRLYRTGDRVRYRADGNLEFLGRMDHQVKLRGHRIERSAIESALLDRPEIEQAVALVREDNLDERRLVIYLRCKAEEFSEQRLREQLRLKLPDYMLPSTFVRLDRFPVGPNGKVDRRQLPVPERSVVQGHHVPARRPIEQATALIWADVLHLERVGIHDDFFEIGGDSLRAAQVAARMRAVLAMELPLRTLFERPTIVELTSMPYFEHVSSARIDAVIRLQTVIGSMTQTEVQDSILRLRSQSTR